MSVPGTRKSYALVGDIGGTRSLLELFVEQDGALRSLHEGSYRSSAFAAFAALLEDFFAQAGVAPGSVDAACFSVAGPVEGGICALTNLDWQIDATALSAHFKIPEVRLLNDFAAVGHGIASRCRHRAGCLRTQLAGRRLRRPSIGSRTHGFCAARCDAGCAACQSAQAFWSCFL